VYYFILYSKFESEYLIKEEKVTHKEQDRLLEEALDKGSATKGRVKKTMLRRLCTNAHWAKLGGHMDIFI
jgi:hypothetical protein